MEASSEWPPFWIPKTKRPWKQVCVTLACSFFMIAPCVLPSYPCVFLFVPSRVPNESLLVAFCTLACYIFNFSSLSYFFPSQSYVFSRCLTFFLSVALLRSHSYFSLRCRTSFLLVFLDLVPCLS